MSRTSQVAVFILLKAIKRHEEKRPEGRTELTNLKTNNFNPARNSTCTARQFLDLEN